MRPAMRAKMTKWDSDEQVTSEIRHITFGPRGLVLGIIRVHYHRGSEQNLAIRSQRGRWIGSLTGTQFGTRRAFPFWGGWMAKPASWVNPDPINRTRRN